MLRFFLATELLMYYLEAQHFWNICYININLIVNVCTYAFMRDWAAFCTLRELIRYSQDTLKL